MWKYGVYLLKEKDVLKRGCAWNFVFWFGQIKIGNKKQTMLRIVNSIPLNWKRAVIVTNLRHPVLLFLGTWWWCLRGQWQRHGGLPLSAGGCRDMPQGRGPLVEEEAQQPHGDRPGLPWKIREWELPALFAWWMCMSGNYQLCLPDECVWVGTTSFVCLMIVVYEWELPALFAWWL